MTCSNIFGGSTTLKRMHTRCTSTEKKLFLALASKFK